MLIFSTTSINSNKIVSAKLVSNALYQQVNESSIQQMEILEAEQSQHAIIVFTSAFRTY